MKFHLIQLHSREMLRNAVDNSIDDDNAEAPPSGDALLKMSQEINEEIFGSSIPRENDVPASSETV